MKTYKYILFDLDNTLWDFHSNSHESLKDAFLEYSLNEKINSFEQFYKVYNIHNDKLWEKYRLGKIDKETVSIQRFYLSMLDFGINKIGLAKEISKKYLYYLSIKNILIPDAIEILEYLKPKYSMCIVTNGFNEVQFQKIKNCNLSPYFKEIITSEEAGALKPNKQIFDYTISKLKANYEESIMIGDDFDIDIKGAKNAGIDQIYYNPEYKKIHDKVTYEIFRLLDLKNIL